MSVLGSQAAPTTQLFWKPLSCTKQPKKESCSQLTKTCISLLITPSHCRTGSWPHTVLMKVTENHLNHSISIWKMLTSVLKPVLNVWKVTWFIIGTGQFVCWSMWFLTIIWQGGGGCCWRGVILLWISPKWYKSAVCFTICAKEQETCSLSTGNQTKTPHLKQTEWFDRIKTHWIEKEAKSEIENLLIGKIVANQWAKWTNPRMVETSRCHLKHLDE